MEYVVKFFNNGQPYWLADWNGDPGRTLKKENAKRFKTLPAAKAARTKAIKENPDRYLRGELTTPKNLACIEALK